MSWDACLKASASGDPIRIPVVRGVEWVVPRAAELDRFYMAARRYRLPAGPVGFVARRVLRWLIRREAEDLRGLMGPLPPRDELHLAPFTCYEERRGPVRFSVFRVGDDWRAVGMSSHLFVAAFSKVAPVHAVLAAHALVERARAEYVEALEKEG